MASTPISADLLSGSSVSFTFGGATRTAPLTGTIAGFIPGGYQLGRDNTIMLTRGTITVGAVDLLTDGCAGPQPMALDPATTAPMLDPRRTSRAFIARSGEVIVDVGTTLRAALDLRGGDCGAGVVSTGYADTPLATMLRGRIAMGTGLSALTLDATGVDDPQRMPIPAAAADPCPGDPAAFATTLAMHVLTKVRIG